MCIPYTYFIFSFKNDDIYYFKDDVASGKYKETIKMSYLPWSGADYCVNYCNRKLK